MRIIFLKWFDNIVMSVLSWVKAMGTGRQLLLKSTKRTQSDAWCQVQTGEVPLRGTFAPFFSQSIDYLAEIGIASFILKILVFHLGRKGNRQTKKTKKWKQQQQKHNKNIKIK